MHKQISKKIFIYVNILILLGSINNLNFYYFEFPKIKNIDIIGVNEEQKIKMLKNLDYMKFQNIFFLETLRINEIISSNNLIEKYYIHKRYPSTLKIEIIKTEILANVLKDGLNYFVGANGKLIETNDLDKNAKIKLSSKNCDWIIANDVSKKESGFDSDYNEVTIHYKNPKNKKDYLSLKKKIRNFRTNCG